MSLSRTLTYSAGGRGVSRVRRLMRTALPLLVAGVGMTGCSTKADIRDVREDLSAIQAQQDSVLRILQLQNRQILDSLQVTTERLMNVRGELANQLTELRDQLVQVGQLTGQVQVRLNQFDQSLAEAVRQMGTAQPSAAAGDQPPAEENSFDEAAQFYEIGLEQKDNGNAGTARRAFQLVVDSFPDHPLAPRSLFQVGETFVMEGSYAQALDTFEAVVRRYQDAEAAPRALYRAGVIAEQQGDADAASEYFRRVVTGYPNSDARRLAEAALERMD